MACDMPTVTPAHLRRLVASGQMMASSYAGRKAVPAYFPRDLFPELLKLKGDVGAREVLKHAHEIELAGGELDVDTPEDFAQTRSLFS